MYVRRTNNQPELVVVRERENDNDGIKCLKGVVRQATSVDPKHRQTAEEVYQQLQNLVSVFLFLSSFTYFYSLIIFLITSFANRNNILLQLNVCRLFNRILLGHLGADENVDGV